MIQSPIERHIFRDADEFFNLKHDLFAEDYLGECLMGGDALNHTPIDEVAFIYKDSDDPIFNSRVLNGIINSLPLINVTNNSLEDSKIIFDIYYLNNYEDIEDFFCLKTTFDFMVEGVMIYQIFNVEIKSLDMINDFWLTSSADTVLW